MTALLDRPATAPLHLTAIAALPLMKDPRLSGTTAQTDAIAAVNALIAAKSEPADTQVALLRECARCEAACRAEIDRQAAMDARAPARDAAARLFTERMERVFGLPGVCPGGDDGNEAYLPDLLGEQAYLRMRSPSNDFVIVEPCDLCPGGERLSLPLTRGLEDFGRWLNGDHRCEHEHPAALPVQIQEAFVLIQRAVEAGGERCGLPSTDAEAYGRLTGALADWWDDSRRRSKTTDQMLVAAGEPTPYDLLGRVAAEAVLAMLSGDAGDDRRSAAAPVIASGTREERAARRRRR